MRARAPSGVDRGLARAGRISGTQIAKGATGPDALKEEYEHIFCDITALLGLQEFVNVNADGERQKALATSASEDGEQPMPLSDAEKMALIRSLGYDPADLQSTAERGVSAKSEATSVSMSKKTAASTSAWGGTSTAVKKSIQKPRELARRHSDGDQKHLEAMSAMDAEVE